MFIFKNTMTATIDLDDIELYAYHGCYAEERKVGGRFRVSVQLEVDATQAAHTDDISNALNYVEAVEIVRDEMAQTSHLLENVVMRICDALWRHFAAKGLQGGSVKVTKVAPPVGVQMKGVSVEMKIAKYL